MNQLESNTRFSKSELELLSRRFYEVADMGEVTRATFGEVMSTAGLPQYSKQFVDRVFEVFDADRSDTVSLNELCTGLSVLTRGTPEEKLNLSFNMYDINGDGQISAEEFHVLLSSLEQGMVLIGKKNVSEVIEQFLKDFDINDDEMISLTEFKLAALREPLFRGLLEPDEVGSMSGDAPISSPDSRRGGARQNKPGKARSSRNSKGGKSVSRNRSDRIGSLSDDASNAGSNASMDRDVSSRNRRDRKRDRKRKGVPTNA